jgi:hypothetical protein
LGVETFFIYDRLQNIDILNRLLLHTGKIISIRPGIIKGKLFVIDNIPILVPPEFGKLKMPPYFVFGSIIEIDISPLGFKHLDSYEGSSLSHTGKIENKRDIMLRTEAIACEITFNSIEQFKDMRYRIIKKPIRCIVYIGNSNNIGIHKKINQTRRGSSVLCHEFFDLFRKEGEDGLY